MSVLKEGAYTVPSRVIGIYNYLINAKDHRENRDKLYHILSPISLVMKSQKNKKGEFSNLEDVPEEENKKDPHIMIKAVVRQCINMNLLIEEDENIKLNPDIDSRDELPSIIANLFFSNHSENHDFARVLAWYLAQDFFDAPGNWQEMEPKLREQIGDELLELNDARYGQFEDWSCYLGFCWQNSLSKSVAVLVPDPTTYLRHRLKRLFQDRAKQQVPIAEFINRLGKISPVFETGQFREEIEQLIELREHNHLSSVTSIALRRLEDAGHIRLEKLSDASVLLLTDGSGEPAVSHISWLGN